MQGSEGQLHLGLDTRCAGELTVGGGLLGDVLEQGRLAHPRLAVDDQSTALSCADTFQQPVELDALGSSALQGAATHSRHGAASPGIVPPYSRSHGLAPPLWLASGGCDQRAFL